MKCAKCLIRDAEPGSLYCSRCKKGVGFYTEYRTFEDFKSQLYGMHKIRSLAILDDVLLTYKYYKEFGIFVPILEGPMGYWEEHKKAEDYFFNLFSAILEERLKAIGITVGTGKLRNQFDEFREVLWKLANSSRSDYFGATDDLIVFIRKVLRSNKIDLNTDFVESLGNFFYSGSAIFLLELFAELVAQKKGEKVINDFLSVTKSLMKKYCDDPIRKVVNFPVVLLKPWEHQDKAFNAWLNNRCKGIIEMATATGKTLLGLMAIQKLASEMEKRGANGSVLITSHSRAILNQWKQEVLDKLGLKGGGDYKVPVSCEYVKIEFETVQTLIRRDNIKKVNLLIIDEVHHIAAPEFRKIFDKIDYDWVMGLSASPDEGYRANIFREIGLYPPVYRFGLKEAIEESVLPQFDWYLHPVYISDEEMEEFTEISDQIAKIFYTIKNDKTTKEFLRKLEEGEDSLETLNDFVKLIEKARFMKLEVPDNWKKLAVLVTQRRWLIHRSLPKIEEAIEMAKEYYFGGKKTIVFTMDIESCEYIKEKLNEDVDDVFVIHSNVRNPFEVLKAFKECKNGILIGARMLDEGLDIPDAEVGLNVAASKTRIQLIQRLGRILRKHGDKRPIFHHFVGVPPEKNYLDFEDPFWILDEVSWVQDTALSMGVGVKVIEADAKKIIGKSERKLKEYASYRDIYIPSYGVLKIGRILNQFPEEAIQKIISILDAMPEGKTISDDEWFRILRESFVECGKGLHTVKGHWWILVLGDRKPERIKENLKTWLKSHA